MAQPLEHQLAVADLDRDARLDQTTPRRSFDDLIRPQHQRRRDREAECLGGLQIDDEVELTGLLDWKITGLCAFDDLVHVVSHASHDVRELAP